MHPKRDVMVSNIDQPVHSRSDFEFDFAQAFTTDGRSSVLYSVDVGFLRTDPAMSSETVLEVSVHADASNNPGTLIGELINPVFETSTSLSAVQQYGFVTRAREGIKLQPNTRYWIVIDNHVGNLNRYISNRNNNQHDRPDVTGWTINNGARHRNWASNGNWTTWTSGTRAIRINGQPTGEPVLVSNLGQTDTRHVGSHDHTVTVRDLDHVQRFQTGGNSRGYLLDSVDIEFERLSDSAAFSKMRVLVRNRTSGLSPGQRVVAVLAPPSDPPENRRRVYRFAAAQADQAVGGVRLAPNTPYEVVVDVTAQLGANNNVIGVSNSDAEDAGSASGWSIRDSRETKAWNSNSRFGGHSDSLRMRLNGKARVADAPWVRVRVSDAVEGGNMTVTATIPAAHSEALSFWADLRSCGYKVPGLHGPSGRDAVEVCDSIAEGVANAEESDFDFAYPDGSVRAFVNIPAGQTSGTLTIPVIANDGAEPEERIAVLVTPFRKATRDYLRAGRHPGQWVHPATPAAGHRWTHYPIWVATISASSNQHLPTPASVTISTDAVTVTEGQEVIYTITSDPAPQVDLVVDVTADQQMGVGGNAVAVASIDQVTIPAGDTTTTWTVTAMTDNVHRADGSITAGILGSVDDTYTLGTPHTTTIALTDDDAPDRQTTQQQDQQSYTFDPAVVAAVQALAGQTHHGTTHVNRWNRVLVAFGKHDGAGVTGGAMTLDEAEQNTKTFSSPVWAQVVTELTNQQNHNNSGGGNGDGGDGGTPQVQTQNQQQDQQDPPDPPQQDPPGGDTPTSDPPQQDRSQESPDPPQQEPQQESPQQDRSQESPDPPQQEPQQDPLDPPQQEPQQGYTVDAAVVARVKALAAQKHHGFTHVNRWNRVLVAFGEHDGTGVTGGAMTLDEAILNDQRHSSPVWSEVVTELTNLHNPQ